MCLQTSKILLKSGAKSGKIKAEYKHDLVTLNTDVDINLGGPLVNASAVIGHQGWLAGYQLAFDTGKSTLTKNNFCLGYSTGDFVLHTNVNDGQVFGGSVYQKVNPNLETAINLGNLKLLCSVLNIVNICYLYSEEYMHVINFRLDCVKK